MLALQLKIMRVIQCLDNNPNNKTLMLRYLKSRVGRVWKTSKGNCQGTLNTSSQLRFTAAIQTLKQHEQY